MTQPRPLVIVMVKTPRPGRAKTRLARAVGTVAAAGWQRRQTARLLRSLGRDPRFETRLAVTPDADAADPKLWPRGLARCAQGPGGLGRRMARALAAAGPRPAVLIGSDIPEITPRHLLEALRALGRADVVFGPAPDGGYWLIGFRPGPTRAAAARRLEAVRWSHPETLADSRRAFAGLRIATAAMLADVDEPSDLGRAAP